MGLLLVFPGPSRPLPEDIPKKEEATKSYTLRFDDRRSPQNTDEGESNVPVRVLKRDTRDTRDTKRRPKLPGLKRGELDVTWEKKERGEHGGTSLGNR